MKKLNNRINISSNYIEDENVKNDLLRIDEDLLFISNIGGCEWEYFEEEDINIL